MSRGHFYEGSKPFIDPTLVWKLPIGTKLYTLRAAQAQEEQEEQEPVAWTDRELQLIDGMIEVQLHHAAQCDGIANRTMAEKQKGWDMERAALLQKIKSNPPRREWKSLTEEEIDCWTPEIHPVIRAIEQALKEKNA
jgi:hypothetical protein